MLFTFADNTPTYDFRAILKKVSVQFLPTDTNWKGGTLDKSLFILELGKIAVQFHPPTTEFFSYLV